MHPRRGLYLPSTARTWFHIPIATSIVHSKLDYCNSLYYKLPKSQLSVSSRSGTLLIVLWLKLPSPVISLPSYALSTGSESLNASNTSSSHLPTKFSQLPNLLPYLHDLISVQRPRSTRSSSVITLARPPTSSSLKVTDQSFRYASPCL